jgi:hypothetical protein
MCFFLIIWSCAASKNRTDSNYSLNLVEIRHPKKFSSLYRLKIQSRKFLRMSNLNQITMPLCHDLQSPRLRYLFVFLFVFFPILLTFKHYGIYENNAPVWYQWQNTHFVQFFARRLNTIGNTDKRVSLRTEKSPVLEVTTCFCFDSRPTQVLWFYVTCIRFAK